MASKTEMDNFACKFFLEYCQLLELCEIKHDTFFKWWHRFKTYEGIRKASNFIKGGKGPTKTCFLVSIILLNQIWKKLPTGDWSILLSISDSSDREVDDLRKAIIVVKKTWSQRPKPPRGNN